MREIKLSFVGDMLCYPDMTENTGKNYDKMLAPLKDELKNCDYLVGNLETPVAGEDMLFTHERYCFNTPEEFLGSLKNAGFGLLSLANNHCMDRGEDGILRTLENCKKYGFDTVGLYASQKDRDTVFVKEIGGIKIAFVNYTYGTNAFAHRRFLSEGKEYMVNLFQPEETLDGFVHLLDPPETVEKNVKAIYEDGVHFDRVKPHLDQLKRDLEEAKKQADFVVMLAHVGGQRNLLPDAYSKLVMKKIKEYGADVIVGLHPHIIQSCDTTDGYLTVYDLGNFLCSEGCFGEDTIVDQSLSVLLNLYLTKNDDGKISMRAGFKLVKIVTENGVPYVYNLYELCTDKATTRTSVGYANFFAGKTVYYNLQDEYILPL